MIDTTVKKKEQVSEDNTQKQETSKKYIPSEIEQYWQAKWEKEKIYQTNLETDRPPFYNLMMFPYPSAEGLHVGNVYTFSGIDAYGRFKRMQGYEVFEPIGLDGFGIHSENYAIKVGRTPQEHARISEDHFYKQLHMIGNGYDWSRTVETYKPNYYKWTQWLFTELFKAGLAYKAEASVNFCPSCKTVLSDEQVIQKVKSQNSKVKNNEGEEKDLEVSTGVCERCETPVEKKNLSQWFFRITDYAERLLANTEKLDWTEKVKIAQKNWIGKSVGARVTFRIENTKLDITVFTTRPDTLYGATFLVVSPEHPVVAELLKLKVKSQKSKVEEIQNYIESVRNKSEQDRIAEGKEKTGVFTGVYAINPVNNERIPVWIADYVLFGYGTGAIMAVPAHDTRDFEFAKNYNLPIKQVVAPETGTKRENEERRDGGCAIIFDPQTQKYAVATAPDRVVRLFAGGVDSNEDLEKGIMREVTEESGLYDFKHVEKVQTSFSHFYNSRRNVNRVALATCYLIILRSNKQQERKLEPHEQDLHVSWMSAQDILKNWHAFNNDKRLDHWISFLHQAVGRAIELGYDKTSDKNQFQQSAYTGEGLLIDSGEWDGLKVPEAIERIINWLEEKKIGSSFVNYHLRDWLISRQRYWGPPIPMIFCSACKEKGDSWFTSKEAKEWKVVSSKYHVSSEEHNIKYLIPNTDFAGWYPVPLEQLPVALPIVEDFKPLGTGKAPLANYPEFYETTCPECGNKATRETDVSDTFLDSAWYFFRYTSTDIEDDAFATDRVKKWLPVTSYIGGAEHAVLHLLYSRFMTMVLHDLGYIEFEEPFARFRANGLIIKDGAKMSKSKGNVINPDDYVRKFGADTLRTYLGFIGPFTQGGDFQDTGIEGIWRFLNRVWKLVVSFELPASNALPSNAGRSVVSKNNETESISMMHRTIKGVTEDMEELRFNTAIAKIMTYYNFLVDQKEVSREEIEVLLRLLAPFAPHLTEELYQKVSNVAKVSDVSKAFKSIHTEKWPDFDAEKIVSDTVMIAVQINGKLRETVSCQQSVVSNQQEIEELAKEQENVKKHLEGKTVKKVIYVPGKIISFVI